jgi:hypothetical protein
VRGGSGSFAYAGGRCWRWWAVAGGPWWHAATGHRLWTTAPLQIVDCRLQIGFDLICNLQSEI